MSKITSSKQIEKDIEQIIRYYRYPHYGRTFNGLIPVVKQIRRYIEANYAPKQQSGGGDGA